jgi:hypothetical protein
VFTYIVWICHRCHHVSIFVSDVTLLVPSHHYDSFGANKPFYDPWML